jgi:hypothetical protein
VVAGKPERALFDETIDRLGGERPLMVGDRLDTDIDGAINAGIDSLVVLTGVSSLQDVVDLDPDHRPTYVGPDLAALVSAHSEVTLEGDRATCGSATAVVVDDVARLDTGDPSTVDGLRAVVELAWATRDRSGRSVRVDGTLVA